MARTTSSTGAPVDVAARLRRTASEHPDHVALRWSGGQTTYAQLHQRVDEATAALQRLGVAPGERVAMVLGTTPTFVEVSAAVLRAGATMVPLLPGLAPDELRFAINDSEAKVVIVGPERAAAVAELRSELPLVTHLVVADGDGSELAGQDGDGSRGAGQDGEGSRGAGQDGDGDGSGGDGQDRDPSPSWEQLRSSGGEPDLVERDLDDLAALVYTSGTTGRPRGAMLTRRNLAANQDQSLAGRFQVSSSDIILLVLPLAHIYSLNVGLGASITAGATMVLVERFDPEQVLAAIAEHQVTVVLGAPPMYAAWVQAGSLEDADLSSVRLAVSGAAPLPIPVLERFRDLTGITIEEGYGLTEASPSVSATSMADAPTPGSVGLPLPDVELRLVDDDGTDVDPGDEGEVWVRGPNVFKGYWNDDAATARALTADGWLRTGDVGIRDEHGMLFLVDRLKDLVIVNGFNVYPREVERVLLGSGLLAQAAVVGVPHPLTGEALVAYVVPLRDGDLDVDLLDDRCREQLARYKCPSRIEVVEDLPTTATGKVRRIALRGREPA